MAINAPGMAKPPPKANPTPREQFVERGLQHELREFLSNPSIDMAIQYALLEYQSTLGKRQVDNFNLAAAYHFKLTGAMEFIDTFRGLASMTAPLPRIVSPGNLEHKV